MPRPSKPPPLWFVSNGDVVVGPVTTNLLLRGVAADRVPNDCIVRERTWNAWRELASIREVAALRRTQRLHGSVQIEKTSWKPPTRRNAELLQRLESRLVRARDPGDMLLYCLSDAMAATGALVGAVHRWRSPYIGLVTSCVHGPGMAGKLGHLLPDSDPVAASAAFGDTLCEQWTHSGKANVVSERLGRLPSNAGVAMVPLIGMGRLYAIIELGRPDHGFRSADFDALVDIACAVTTRLNVIRNCS
jgi:hypothetical protein